MRCLDDCHTYEMETFFAENPEGLTAKDLMSIDPPVLHFYEMREDGTKIDGVTNEEVLRVLIHRIKYLNDHWGNPPGRYRCRENSIVITKLEEALMWLEKRTADRTARGVEGKLIP